MYLNNLFKKIKSSRIVNYICSSSFGKNTLQDCESFKKNIFEILISLDFQVPLAQKISSLLIDKHLASEITNRDHLKRELTQILISHYNNSPLLNSSISETDQQKPECNLNLSHNKCNIFLIIGSNGVGKTSFISKLVYFLHNKYNSNLKILLVAGDTFRAGATDQLKILSEQAKVDIQLPNYNEKSTSLIYRTLTEKKNYDLIIFDSSGKQFNSNQLYLEVDKQCKLINKLHSSLPEELFLIIDSTLGTYSHSQLKEIIAQLPITGLVLTKVDNTTRGGVIYNLKPESQIPIKFICFGEKNTEIIPFEITSITSQLVESIFSHTLGEF